MKDLLQWLVHATETIRRLRSIHMSLLVCLVSILCITRVALAALTGQ